jgi:hypothetical protein
VPLPLIVVAPLAAGAPWIARVLVRWAWSPLVVGIGVLLKSRMGVFIASAFVWLGIAFTTNKLVLQPAIAALEAYSAGGAVGGGEFGAVAIGYLGVLNFDIALTMIISAVATKHLASQGRMFLTRRAV